MEATFNQLDVAKCGVEFSAFFEKYAEINNRLWSAYRRKEIKKIELTQQRFQLTFEALRIRGIDGQEMNDHYLNEMPSQKVLVDGAIEVLKYLKEKGYRLFIITNGFGKVQHNKLQSSGLAPYFEKIFISEEVKCPKPGRQIFEHAIKSANAKKSKSLMIGDDWDVDVVGALSFGIDAVCYSQNIDTVKNFKNYKANCSCVSSLKELMTLL